VSIAKGNINNEDWAQDQKVKERRKRGNGLSLKMQSESVECSSESEFSLKNRNRRKAKKIKRRVGRPSKDEPFIVFERAERRPDTVGNCLIASYYAEHVKM
jgi:hypothetical protein